MLRWKILHTLCVLAANGALKQLKRLTSSQRLKNFLSRVNCRLNFVFGNYSGHKKRFKLAAWKIEAAFQHSPKVFGVTICIARRRGCPVGNFSGKTVAAGTCCR
jgi:hypothetical protein